jgi:hypothetical protein
MINVITGDDHDHETGEHEETSYDVVVETTTVGDTSHAEHAHEHSGLDGLFEVMFGFEHVMAEFFWNAVFIIATYFVTKGIALRKAHKYIDGKHGVTHDKKDY